VQELLHRRVTRETPVFEWIWRQMTPRCYTVW
jgi:hypothetical protein